MSVTLENLCAENIRENWQSYKDKISCESHMYESLWDDLIQKYHIDEHDILFEVLKHFIKTSQIMKISSKSPIKVTYANQTTDLTSQHNIIEIKGLSNNERRLAHQLCDQIGLHHVSKTNKKKRILTIIIPERWCWEFSEKNPYSESKEYYQQRLEDHSKREEIKLKKLRSYECENCGETGDKTELFCSVYVSGIYCEECLDIVSDGDGNELSCHKFESIRYLI